MDRSALCFLNSLRCAMQGHGLDTDPGLSPEEWDAFFTLAETHKVLPLVFEAVHNLPELQTYPSLPMLKRTVYRQVMIQTQKTAEFLALIRTLSDAGLQPLVVKGLLCRRLYPQPDHRSSSDEDLLIPTNQLPLYHKVLTDAGLQTNQTDMDDSYEIPYRQPGGVLYIELHKHLFPPDSVSYGDLNRFFRNPESDCRYIIVDGTKLRTLSPTDHLFYLICHAFKHFLHSGFGIRQVCDIVLFASAWGKEIQWSKVEENCRRIRAFRFAAALFRIGKTYLDFDAQAACMPESWYQVSVDEGPMLEDLLNSGVYGTASLSRRHSSSITLDAVAAQNRGHNSRSGLLASLFPSASSLQGRYPYLKNRPWLLPAAWSSRIYDYCQETLHRPNSSAADALNIGKERIQLLKQYGILEDSSRK